MRSCLAIVGFVLLAAAANADDVNIAQSFFEATEDEPHNMKVYHLDDCIFEKIVIVPKYCENTGLGTGGRTITQRVDLSEVEEMRARWFGGEINGEPTRNFHTRFRLDLPTPGAHWVLRDRLTNGRDGARDRYMEKIAELRAGIETNSKTIYATCADGVRESKPLLAFITETRPTGVEALAQLVRECRGSAPFEFMDDGQ